MTAEKSQLPTLLIRLNLTVWALKSGLIKISSKLKRKKKRGRRRRRKKTKVRKDRRQHEMARFSCVSVQMARF